MTDEELIADLREISEDPPYYLERLGNFAADRIEALVKGYNEALNQLDSARYSVEVLEKRVAHFMARAERLAEALHNCVGLLDQLVAESGRAIEWGAEDPFRMGEWFEPEDLAQIEQARAVLKGAKK